MLLTAQDVCRRHRRLQGGLSAGNYRTIIDATTATATRDFTELVELGALRKQGTLRHTRYYLLED